MNIKLVLATYSKLRQLTDDETALLETLRGLSDSEHEAVVQALAPQRAGSQASKQVERCTHTYASGQPCNGAKRNIVHHNANHIDYHEFTAKKAGKSARASGMAAQLNKSLKAQRQVTGGFADDTDAQRCTTTRDDGKPCGLLPDHNVHHLESAVGYHPFDSSSSVQSVAGTSSPSVSDQLSAASSATEQVDAGSVAQGASGGD
jgi:hypothetical protein